VVGKFMNQGTQELNKIFILEIDTEEEAVEKCHWVLLDVICVLSDAFNDFGIQ